MGRRKATSGETEEDNKRHRTTGPASKGHWVEVNETLPPVLTSPTAKLKPERPPAPPPVQTDGTVRCSHWNCKTRKDGGYLAADGLKYCLKHKCEKVDCPNQVQGSSKACKAHGGGKRCTTENCTKSAQGYTPFCNNHGGGKKCMNPDCVKPARVRGGFCNSHSEAARCRETGCTKYKQKNGLCIAHHKATEGGKGVDMLEPVATTPNRQQPNSATL